MSCHRIAAVVVMATVVLLFPACGAKTDDGRSGRATAVVEVVSTTRPTVVFDVDGTLSAESGDPITLRPGGPAVVEAWIAKGYHVVVLTARAEVFREATNVWLQVGGFPEVELVMSPDFQLTDRRRQDFKAETLLELVSEQGLSYRYAYGDAEGDFAAYARAGIPRENVFALLSEGDPACQPGAYRDCLVDYQDHLDFIESQPAAD